MHQKTFTALVLAVALAGCRDGPSALAGPVGEDAAPRPNAVVLLTDIFDDPLVHDLAQQADVRGTVSRLQRSVLDMSHAPTDEEASALRRAFAEARGQFTAVAGKGVEADEADREIHRAVLALVLADAEHLLETAGTRDVTGAWVNR